MRKQAEHDRPFFKALLYTRHGDLDLGWALLLAFALVAIWIVLWVIVIHPATMAVQLAALSFLASAFMGVLIAAIPIAKARILASSKLPGGVAEAVGEAGHVVTDSTDIKEAFERA